MFLLIDKSLFHWIKAIEKALIYHWITENVILEIIQMESPECLIKKASSTIDSTTTNLIKNLTVEPKIGLYYINEHVINLDA